MAYWRKYRLNYQALYPNVPISGEILKALRKSDRKLRYMEHDLKEEAFLYDPDKMIARLLPAREISYDHLQQEVCMQFPTSDLSPEDTVVLNDTYILLRQGLRQLPSEDQFIIRSLFFDGLSERELSSQLGIPQRTLNDRKRRALAKLKNFLEGPKNNPLKRHFQR